MQEIILILSSLAGVATVVAARKIPRGKNQLLSLGASSHIKSQINSLKIEKDILTLAITRLYQTDSEFCKIQNDCGRNLQGTRENAVYGHLCVPVFILCREGGRSQN